MVRPSLGEIQLGPERVHIEPRSMEVLLALTARPSEVMPKEELIATVWGEAFVSDEVLTHAIWDLRRAFGDNASDPEFIQTIPKKGYRLIAPVRWVEQPRRRVTDRQPGDGEPPPGRQTALRVLVGVALLMVVIAWIAWTRQAGEPEPIAPPEPAEDLVLLLPARMPEAPVAETIRLDRRLLDNLTALGDLNIRSQPECEVDPLARDTYCLEPVLISTAGFEELDLSLTEARTARQIYTASVSMMTSEADLDRAAEELADIVGAYFEVRKDPYYLDGDIGAWVNLGGHDPRAVRDFLFGVRYVYRHEEGGRDAFEVAMRRDPDFIAPHVWRTPTVYREGTAEEKAAHRGVLRRLYERGNAFERAMIMWALALMDNDPAEQLLHLEVALGEARGNRMALNAHALAHLLLGDIEAAWQDYERLLRSRWNFPGLYPAAAYCAVRLERLEYLRRALEPALAFPVIDLNSLVMLRLLAIFDEDDQTEATLVAQLESLEREQPDALEPEIVGLVAAYLAAKAESQGRPGIAIRLRESVD